MTTIQQVFHIQYNQAGKHNYILGAESECVFTFIYLPNYLSSQTGRTNQWSTELANLISVPVPQSQLQQ